MTTDPTLAARREVLATVTPPPPTTPSRIDVDSPTLVERNPVLGGLAAAVVPIEAGLAVAVYYDVLDAGGATVIGALILGVLAAVAAVVRSIVWSPASVANLVELREAEQGIMARAVAEASERAQERAVERALHTERYGSTSTPSQFLTSEGRPIPNPGVFGRPKWAPGSGLAGIIGDMGLPVNTKPVHPDVELARHDLEIARLRRDTIEADLAKTRAELEHQALVDARNPSQKGEGIGGTKATMVVIDEAVRPGDAYLLRPNEMVHEDLDVPAEGGWYPLDESDPLSSSGDIFEPTGDDAPEPETTDQGEAP